MCVFAHSRFIEVPGGVVSVKTLDYGLLLSRSSSSDLIFYMDANWAGCPDTHRSTSGYVVLLGDILVSWSAKQQTIISRSSAEP
jgi:hypothetical protein